jgi:TPP-dependent pyruvate/acetoin dehydrogenase alpha subunit
VARAVRRARAGEGPSLIEALTYRLGGHWASDPGGYRAEGELEEWRRRDPLPRLEAVIAEKGDLDRAGIERLWAEVRDEVQRAVDVAQAAPAPGPQDLGLDEVLAK